MTRHNNDIAACEGKNCPMRTTCLRWQLGQTMEDYHWFGEFKPKNGVCAYHIWTNEKLNDGE